MDISIIRELLNEFIECFSIISEINENEASSFKALAKKYVSDDKQLLERAKEILSKLPSYEIGKYGQLKEWHKDYEEYDVHHRHVSHLYGLYPSNQIADEKILDACKTTLLRRGDEGTGWCMAWKACLWARLRDGNKALKLVKNQLRPCKTVGLSTRGGGVYPNGFCAHPPFQIDGNFGLASAVTEMLIFSDKDKIVLLPALPSEWTSGKFKGVKAKGNLKLDFEFENGKLTKLKIKSVKAKIIALEFNGKLQKIDLTAGENVII